MKLETIAILFAAALAAIPAYAEEIDAAAFIAAHNKWRAKAGVSAGSRSIARCRPKAMLADFGV